MQCFRGTCPIRGPIKVQDNARIAKRKERVLALASTMLLVEKAKKSNDYKVKKRMRKNQQFQHKNTLPKRPLKLFYLLFLSRYHQQ
ncbi:MAG: hypothetical protein QW594_00520 [Candidatus Woesearchaeota archaeon]